GIISTIGTLVKGKVLVTTIVGTALLVSGGAALAATTSGGQDVVNTITGHHATMTPTHQADTHDKASPPAKDNADKDSSKDCPGGSEAQQLATKFSLSADSKGSSVQAICTLHDGTFKGTVDNNGVTTDHALGYGEIEQLLTYAQSLAKKAH